jgi:AcrR family transcriptional regulator
MNRDSSAPPAQAARRERQARNETQKLLLAAAETWLRQEGFVGLSTRRVAELARVPLSQIHYHFGSRHGLVLALLEDLNARLLARQAGTFEAPLALSERWERACDYLDEDLTSGFVRILQEMIAAGWSDPEVAAAARSNFQGWYALLTRLAEEAASRFGGLGPFTPAELSCLIGNAFIGSEALILLGWTMLTSPPARHCAKSAR